MINYPEYQDRDMTRLPVKVKRNKIRKGQHKRNSKINRKEYNINNTHQYWGNKSISNIKNIFEMAY